MWQAGAALCCSLGVVLGLLTAVASRVEEHRLSSCGVWAQLLCGM